MNLTQCHLESSNKTLDYCKLILVLLGISLATEEIKFLFKKKKKPQQFIRLDKLILDLCGRKEGHIDILVKGELI